MADCWLTLDDDLASRYHARFHVDGAQLAVEDLGSRNGTHVNGLRIEGRVPLKDGDEVIIGRERIVVVSVATVDGAEEPADDRLRKTMGPGEDAQFPSLIGQLVDKSLKVGKVKEAERYLTALLNQIAVTKVARDHPTAVACVASLLSVVEKTSSGIWLDRVFKLHAQQGWVMADDVLDRVRATLDRIPRIPGKGLHEYELRLRELTRDGLSVPPHVLAQVAEIRDTFGGG